MNRAVEQGKADFLIHKLKQYIEDERIDKDIPAVLRRCLTIEDAVYRDWAQRQSYSNSPKLFCELVGDGVQDYYAKDSLGLELPKEISEDLAQISVIQNGAALTAENFGHHPFLVEAKKWWDEKGWAVPGAEEYNQRKLANLGSFR